MTPLNKLYWRLRYTFTFLVNLPVIPIYLVWMLTREVLADLFLCFTTQGETERQFFWQWPWGGSGV